tara:strand:- start:74 stop:409 length:336 start_codon:yes stop_codon:yes gene_type:complete
MANPNKAPRRRRQVGYEGYPSIETRKYPAVTHFKGVKIQPHTQMWANVATKPYAESVKKRLIGEGYLPSKVSIGLMDDGSYVVWLDKRGKRKAPPEGWRYDEKGNVRRGLG